MHLVKVALVTYITSDINTVANRPGEFLSVKETEIILYEQSQKEYL